MSNDALSAVLDAVRLEGAVFFAVEASAPWVVETPAAREVGPHLLPAAAHIIDYHVVRQGPCWGGILGEAPIRLATGDIIAFPHGDPHVMSSEPGLRGTPELDAVGRVRTSRLPVMIEKHGGGSERASLICGFLGCDDRPFNPLLAALPRLMHVPRRAKDASHLEQLVLLALAESEARRSGGECVLARLSELLFIEVVRRHLSELPEGQGGWLGGLRDASIGRVLAKFHERPAQDWTLEDLAREVGMSRSVLAERFSHFVGLPPMQYLAQWRMQLASSLLSKTALGLAEIAERVGYGSEAALSRAYKRCVGVAPAEWRRGKRNPGALPPASEPASEG
ncbi:MAG TPA: AraC family transcriptional regulator [Polyangiaceae bacterium]|nr:AraC family transcriptional regulator [Polyangiaceae bacterium]